MKLEEAIKHLKSIQNGAQIVLDSGFGNKENEHNGVYTSRIEWTNLAIQALEKQVAKKPILIPHWSPSKKDYECPVCKGEVSRSWEYDHDGDTMTNTDFMEYCPSCGQKIDWSDED